VKFNLHIIKQKTLPITWLLLGLLAIYPIAEHAWSGIILCIGADGHIELEDGKSGDCATELGKATSETHFDHEISEMEPGEFEDCGPCVDVALLTSPFDVQRASKIEGSSVFAFSPQLTIHSVLPDDNRISARLPNPPEAAATPFFTPLRTIALLI